MVASVRCHQAANGASKGFHSAQAQHGKSSSFFDFIGILMTESSLTGGAERGWQDHIEPRPVASLPFKVAFLPARSERR